MAGVPVTIRGTMYPKDKSVKPYPFTLLGVAEITGLQVGGGPILPPDEVPPVDPPLVIWGGPIDPYPDIGFPMPQPPFPPNNPPVNPEPPHEGWNFKPSTPSNPSSGWYYLYVPGPGDPQPKRPGR